MSQKAWQVDSQTSAPSLLALKVRSEAASIEEKSRLARRKGAIVLCARFLQDIGSHGAADKLQQETGMSLQSHQPADNVDIMSILQEYEDFYHMKFGRRPRLFRAADGGSAPAVHRDGSEATMSRPTAAPVARPSELPPLSAPAGPPAAGDKPPPDPRRLQQRRQRPTRASSSMPAAPAPEAVDLSLAAVGVSKPTAAPPAPKAPPAAAPMPASDEPEGGGDDWRFMRPIALDGVSSDMRELFRTIQRDIMAHPPDIRWTDVVGLDAAKQLLRESVVFPVKYPQLFVPPLRPWRGILLFGPPGTGKTMLAKAVASECKTTFFNISAASLVSKWRGDSEKLVRCLFELARHYAPSTIFIDELDSVMSSRDGGGAGEHEGSRRLKTELLIQMDGMGSLMGGGEVPAARAADEGLPRSKHVFLLAASNMPWDLDEAVLRRLEKRIHVPLPSQDGRRAILAGVLKNVRTEGVDYGAMAAATEGYSGADLDIVCREAMMRRVRVQVERLESAATDDLAGMEAVPDPVTQDDLKAALDATRKSTRSHADAHDKYAKWQAAHGSSM